MELVNSKEAPGDRTEKWIAPIGNAGDFDCMYGYRWYDAAVDAGVPVDRCQSCILVLDRVYAPFDLCDGFDLFPNTWLDTTRDLPRWDNYKTWAKEHGYKVGHINWLNKYNQ